jgi:phage/plasmid-like protein (TIGR03299 family)
MRRSVTHRSQFDAQAVKRQLGVAISAWDEFMARIKALSERKLSEAEAQMLLKRSLAFPTVSSDKAKMVSERSVKAITELYAGKGMGAHLASSDGTAWGLLNSVTEFVDHHRRSHSADHRRDTAWFGAGSLIKSRFWNEALKLVA